MEITVEQQQDITIVKLNGDLDSSTAEETRVELMNQIIENCRLIIDMENCEYVSSAGLRVLMITAKKLKTVEGRGVLANIVSEVEDVMEMTGFGHMLKSFSTTKEAIEFLQVKEVSG